MNKILIILITILLLGNVFSYTIYDLKEDNYNYFDFSISSESNEFTLQPQSSDKTYLYFDLANSEKISFNIQVKDYPDVRAYIVPNISSYSDFYRVINLNVMNAEPGIYPIEFVVTGTLNNKEIIKSTKLYVNVIEKQTYQYQTTKHTNIMPDITIIDFSKRNFIIENNKSETFSIKLMNLGSTSDFSIKTYPDINGLDINFSKNSIKLTSQTEALIFGSVSLDENYALEQSTINIYLIDKSSGLKTDLGTLNINKGIAEYNINTKEQDKNIDLIIQNTGNVDGFLKINTEDSDFVAYIPAGTTKTYNLPKQNIKISEDNKVIKSFGVNVSENNLDATKTNIAGFFTLSSNSTANIVFIILIIALILYIFYKILGKMGLFHNSVSAKKLGIKDN